MRRWATSEGDRLGELLISLSPFSLFPLKTPSILLQQFFHSLYTASPLS
jgi:hypothetical protein